MSPILITLFLDFVLIGGFQEDAYLDSVPYDSETSKLKLVKIKGFPFSIFHWT